MIDLPWQRNDRDYVVDRRRLLWAGPATVAAAIAVVMILQAIAIAILTPGPRSILRSNEPAAFTAILVTLAVIVFVAVSAGSASTPLRIYKEIALAALLVSCVPDVAIGFGLIRPTGWRLASIFIVMHIAAWAVTVQMLCLLTTRRRELPTAAGRTPERSSTATDC